VNLILGTATTTLMTATIIVWSV